jgi:hypothetical protein
LGKATPVPSISSTLSLSYSMPRKRTKPHRPAHRAATMYLTTTTLKCTRFDEKGQISLGDWRRFILRWIQAQQTALRPISSAVFSFPREIDNFN